MKYSKYELASLERIEFFFGQKIFQENLLEITCYIQLPPNYS